VLLPNARSFTALVALHDIEKHMGPTRFVLSTHSGFKGEASHNLLENDKSVDGRGTVAARTGPSVLSLLKDGEASLFDSRILHLTQRRRERPGLQTPSQPSEWCSLCPSGTPMLQR
jgi:hypothetical protein